MAEEKKPTRILRPAKSETVREKVERTAALAEAKPRKLAKTTKKAAAPFRFLGRLLRPVGKVLRFIVPPYFRNSWKELRLVTWPSRRETLRLTGAVIMFSIVFGAVIAAVDYGLEKLFKEVLLK